MRNQNYNFIKKTAMLAFATCFLFSCGNKEDIDAKRNGLLNGDMSTVPQTMKVNDVQTQDFGKLKTQMYTTGCKQVGSSIPVLKAHPNLQSGLTYVVKNSRTENKNKFQLKYDLKLNTQPASGETTLALEGQIHELTLSNFFEKSLDKNNQSVQKKCAIMGAGSETENCYDLQVNYSEEFINKYNKAFKSDLECQIGSTDIAPIEKWSEGQFVLQNSKTIKVYAYTVQTVLNRACEADKESRKVVKTVTRVTSNDVVSNQFSYCGGELVYEKQILRDYKSNEVISDQTYELLLAPIIPTL